MIALAPRCALVVFYLVAIGAFVIRKQALRPQTSLFLKQIKLPIVQIYEEGELKDEFICGNDMRGEPLRLKETLNSRTKESCSTGYIENMYSDDMLAGVKEEKKTFVLKIYRDGCQKCAALDSMFAEFPSEYKSDCRWLAAKAFDIPHSCDEIKERLLDKKED